MKSKSPPYSGLNSRFLVKDFFIIQPIIVICPNTRGFCQKAGDGTTPPAAIAFHITTSLVPIAFIAISKDFSVV